MLANQFNNEGAAGLISEPVIVKTERRWLLAMAGMLGAMLAVTGVFGGGLEYAFDNHWSLKGEYLYVPLKSQGFTSTYTDTTSTVFTIQHHESLSALNVFRVGLNYRFQ